jgi:hypothetical protein
MKQTAVDFLIYHIRQDTFVHSKSTKEWNQVFQQAKEMENKQRHFAYQDGREDVFDWLKKMDYDFLVEEINKSE